MARPWRGVAGAVITISLIAANAVAADDEAVVADYRALHQHLDAERLPQAEAKLKALRDTPLAGHATMAVLRARIEQVDAERVERFLADHGDLAGIAPFRIAWLRELADREAWQQLAAIYDGERDVHVRCAVVQARRALGHKQAAIELALVLWHVGYRQPGRCNAAFDFLTREGALTNERLRARMRLAIEAGNPRLAQAYLDRLPPEQRRIVQNWIKVYDQPAAATELAPDELGTRPEQQAVIASAIRALARREPARAHQVWAAIKTQHALGDAAAAIQRFIALQAVYSDVEAGSEWLANLPDEHADATVHAWRVRDALRAPDWPAVRRFIERMPADQASQPRWRYWQARALQAGGEPAKADELFKRTASAFDYYGFLAADAIAADYAGGDDLLAPRREDQASVRTDVRITRGLLLHRAGDEARAISVWRQAINQLEDRGHRLAAARLANSVDWPWAAMYASGRAGYDGASPLRFPTSYRPIVAAAARTHDVPTPWIYALIRQESAFRNVACSAAGACGLMQLMPATGRWMLQRLGRDSDGLAASLARPEHNIPAGAGYLGYLRERFEHPAVAVAAYNAGPTNVRSWLADGGPRPGSARWIETLPFGETRDYTIHVLFNRAVYDLMANDRTKRLVQILGH